MLALSWHFSSVHLTAMLYGFEKGSQNRNGIIKRLQRCKVEKEGEYKQRARHFDVGIYNARPG
jgi:hypothetical protein